MKSLINVSVRFGLIGGIMVIQAAIFVRRFGAVPIVGEPTWNGRINLRGLESLVVDLR